MIRLYRIKTSIRCDNIGISFYHASGEKSIIPPGCGFACQSGADGSSADRNQSCSSFREDCRVRRAGIALRV